MRILVTGATGFVGARLLPELLRRGHTVRGLSRKKQKDRSVEWLRGDVSKPADMRRALDGIDVVYLLVHEMSGGAGYAQKEADEAQMLTHLAKSAGVKRIIYLGGVEPSGTPSEHLASRLRVGELLRSGPVPTIELRASMIIGAGSASWQLVRDLALRLPAMVLPKWTESKTAPVAIDDVIIALVGALDLEPASNWFDIPGPDVMTGAEIFLRIAALDGRHVPTLGVPFLTPSLSSWWLKLITRGNFGLARELVQGFTSDLLPKDDRYWSLINAPPRQPFEEAARQALEEERDGTWLGALEEKAVGLVGRVLEQRRRVTS
ncbi:MAG: NAD(P)H-binding protein [Archangium sp.]